LLADERRRIAIEVLNDRSTPVELGALSRAVAEREDGPDPTDEETLERLRVTLHHVHLPILNEADVITYDLHELSVVSSRSLPDDFIR